MKRITRLLLVIAALVIAPALATAQVPWGTIVKGAQRIDLGFDGGVGFGEVGTDFAAFAFDVEEAGPLTLEVFVTQIRMGLEYEDDDSILYLFDADGFLVAENDDGPYGYQSLINGAWIEWPGRYYAVVTTHPNFPVIDEGGRFEGFEDEGLSSIEFELYIEYGEREEEFYDGGAYGDAGFGEVEVTIPWPDFVARAEPMWYRPDGSVVEGWVGPEVAVYVVEMADPANVTAEIVITGVENDEYGDSVLFVFDSDGLLISENDDGGFDGSSRIDWIPIERPGRYYFAVTSYPSWPSLDEYGYLNGFGFSEGVPFEFELIISESVQEFGETPFIDIIQSSQHLPITGGRGISASEVREGTASFVFELAEESYVTLEVVVTEVLEGTDYSDSDSVLYVFDTAGRLVAEDDDSGIDNASKLTDVWMAPGEYFAVVATYPNYPETDFDGMLIGFPNNGGSHIRFDLVARTEPSER